MTDVTDGFSFFADYDGGQYVVRDYWDEEVLQTISRDATLDTFDFVNPFAAGFDKTAKYIEEFVKIKLGK